MIKLTKMKKVGMHMFARKLRVRMHQTCVRETCFFRSEHFLKVHDQYARAGEGRS